MSEDETARSTEEQAILDHVAEDCGEKFVEENKEVILADADRMGLI